MVKRFFSSRGDSTVAILDLILAIAAIGAVLVALWS